MYLYMISIPYLLFTIICPLPPTEGPQRVAIGLNLLIIAAIGLM